jgi:1-deoxy-D-xylulose-5-phosphate synthase
MRARDLGPLLIVFNDNQMSIAPNVGAIPAILRGGQVREFFELLGFAYVGPVDGHDLSGLIETLETIRRGLTDRPVVLHAYTQKGKGYAPAEEDPSGFHGVNPLKEKVPDQPQTKQKTFSGAFGEALVDLATRDDRIVAITAAMPEGTGLTEFSRRFPDRFFDVGIAEPHAVVFAAGLATQGFRPVVVIYSTFLQRGVDAIIHDVALQKLPVIFAIDRAGLVGADGPTHHGMFDLAYLSMIPGLTVTAPACLEDVRTLLSSGFASGRPFALRYPRGGGVERILSASPTADGFREYVSPEDPSLIVVAVGATASRAEEAARALGRPIVLWSVTQVKPIPDALIQKIRARPELPILIVENGVNRGGFGEALIAAIGPREGKWELAGFDDSFVGHGSPSDLDEYVGQSVVTLSARMEALLKRDAPRRS